MLIPPDFTETMLIGLEPTLAKKVLYQYRSNEKIFSIIREKSNQMENKLIANELKILIDAGAPFIWEDFNEKEKNVLNNVKDLKESWISQSQISIYFLQNFIEEAPEFLNEIGTPIVKRKSGHYRQFRRTYLKLLNDPQVCTKIINDFYKNFDSKEECDFWIKGALFNKNHQVFDIVFERFKKYYLLNEDSFDNLCEVPEKGFYYNFESFKKYYYHYLNDYEETLFNRKKYQLFSKYGLANYTKDDCFKEIFNEITRVEKSYFNEDSKIWIFLANEYEKRFEIPKDFFPLAINHDNLKVTVAREYVHILDYIEEFKDYTFEDGKREIKYQLDSINEEYEEEIKKAISSFLEKNLIKYSPEDCCEMFKKIGLNEKFYPELIQTIKLKQGLESLFPPETTTKLKKKI